VFTVYDIVGLNNARLFPRAYHLAFTDWFAGVMTVADAIACDSRAVADEVQGWLQDHPDQRTRSLPIGYFHLGADIEASRPTQGPEGEGAEVLAACYSRPTLLMVGTVEPRKGHAQALAAVEALWKADVDLNLVIIGKEGWRTQRLARQLRRHPERNRRLYWLEGASDALLLQLYARASALLAASFAEGFGLPLIEAARQGLPIMPATSRSFMKWRAISPFISPMPTRRIGRKPPPLAPTLRRGQSAAIQRHALSHLGAKHPTTPQGDPGNNWYTTYEPADTRDATGAE